MRIGKAVAQTVCVLVLFASCDGSGVLGRQNEPPPSEIAPSIATDRAVYHLVARPEMYEFTMAFTYKNPLRAAVQLPGCGLFGSPYLQRWVDGEWIDAWYAVEQSCAIEPPIELGPGEALTDTIVVHSGRVDYMMPKFRIEPIEGFYRLVLANVERSAASSSAGQPIPLSQRVSAPFRISE